ncbi:uncharacterized protein H6S33_000082 [Morchella sextelata]|uniref:uncharacterized protein n=1 Tax=Morchella sextelata TaxID=1174677 RepID=UPI001D053BF1|nr:uncharacterized protein H6S33_000082 [Morchella sextelata]KAH0614446.1 hypothetical protein H6S33_000082 [Morchella sextelata]
MIPLPLLFPLLTLLLLLLPALASAAAGTTSTSNSLFCKCTCLTNSTLIPIPSCTDCNRSFCRDYNLPFCKGVEDDDVVTTCFQRDSAKDQAVVVIFIVATVGLLVYALVRPWVARWVEAARQRRMYMPLQGE